jgi:hypothetical protein
MTFAAAIPANTIWLAVLDKFCFSATTATAGVALSRKSDPSVFLWRLYSSIGVSGLKTIILLHSELHKQVRRNREC